MKRLVIIASACLLLAGTLSAQVKRPTIMVVPSDVWCNQHGYVTEYDNQGVTQILPDYRRALSSDNDLNNAIARIGNLMTDRGFHLQNLGQIINNIDKGNAQRGQILSDSGASIKENSLDAFNRTARADIILYLNWSVNTVGPKKSVTYNLEGIDAYTGEDIAGAQGTGPQSFSSEIPVLIEEAISTNMDSFTERLQRHFDDLEAYGRSVRISILVFDNGSGINLETEYGDDYDELGDIIDDWMDEHTVGHMFNKIYATENGAEYTDVRIPLYDAKGKGMDAEGFIKELRKDLRQPPYNILSKIVPNGLGNATLILGQQ